MREIVLDTETTGLSPEEGHKIIEIGAIVLENKVITDENFHLYINPERKIDNDALKVHGITEEFLLDKPTFKQIAKKFLGFIKSSDLIIHNASFDLSFINAELLNCGCEEIKENKIIDTLLIARKMFPGAHASLDALCRKYNISLSNRKVHGALVDATLLGEVYIELTGGKQHKLDLKNTKTYNAEDVFLGQSLPNNIYIEKIQNNKRNFSPTETEIKNHRKFISEIKNPIWKKYFKT